MPFTMTGVARDFWFGNSNTQAAPGCFTLVVLICFSVEKRLFDQSPVGEVHSLPAGAFCASAGSANEADTARQVAINKALLDIVSLPLRMVMVFNRAR